MADAVIKDASGEGDWVLSPTGAVYRATKTNSQSKNRRFIGPEVAARLLKAQGANLEALGLADPPTKRRRKHDTAVDDEIATEADLKSLLENSELG